MSVFLSDICTGAYPLIQRGSMLCSHTVSDSFFVIILNLTEFVSFLMFSASESVTSVLTFTLTATISPRKIIFVPNIQTVSNILSLVFSFIFFPLI